MYPGFAVTAYDDYFYIRDIVGPDASVLYRNDIAILTATAAYGDNSVEMCKPVVVATDSDKFVVARRKQLPILPGKYIIWSPDGGVTVEDKTGNYLAAVGAWGGSGLSGSNVYGNAMCVFFEDGAIV
jgi:hypothetical protein